MATYDFKCKKCGKEFEIVKPMSDYNCGEEHPCPDCSTPNTSSLSVPTFILKGGGWFNSPGGYKGG